MVGAPEPQLSMSWAVAVPQFLLLLFLFVGGKPESYGGAGKFSFFNQVKSLNQNSHILP